jgi:hypothetical protein
VTREAVATRAGPTVAQSAAFVAEQTGRPSEEEESTLHTAGETQLVATPSPQTKVHKVEHMERDASAVSLGIMVMVQTTAFIPAVGGVSAT